MLGANLPLKYGASGLGNVAYGLIMYELERVDSALRSFVSVQGALVMHTIFSYGSEEQKSHYLPKLAKGELVGCFALTEHHGGSDPQALETTVRKEGDSFVISGSKMWITNAKEADLFIIFANANPDAGHRGITAFILERNTPGFSIGKKEDKLGIRASSTCELTLDDCRVPASNILGNLGEGYKVAIQTLNEGRIGIAAQMVGVAQGALDHALSYVQQRTQFGRPVGSFQGVQFQLAQATTELEAARLLTYNAARPVSYTHLTLPTNREV